MLIIFKRGFKSSGFEHTITKLCKQIVLFLRISNNKNSYRPTFFFSTGICYVNTDDHGTVKYVSSTPLLPVVQERNAVMRGAEGALVVGDETILCEEDSTLYE